MTTNNRQFYFFYLDGLDSINFMTENEEMRNALCNYKEWKVGPYNSDHLAPWVIDYAVCFKLGICKRCEYAPIYVSTIEEIKPYWDKMIVKYEKIKAEKDAEKKQAREKILDIIKQFQPISYAELKLAVPRWMLEDADICDSENRYTTEYLIWTLREEGLLELVEKRTDDYKIGFEGYGGLDRFALIENKE